MVCRTPPDVYVIVMDSVAAAYANSVLACEMGNEPRLGLLTKKFVNYAKAVTVAPWTLPSHRALITGRYPWERNPAPPSRGSSGGNTTAGALRNAGYQSICISSNAFLSPHFGLTLDFDSVVWGGPWEPFLRYEDKESRTIWHHGDSDRPTISDTSHGLVSEAWSQVLPRVGLRFPRTLRLINAVAAHMTSQGVGRIPVSPWIEDSLERLLKQVPPDKPVHGLVNLMDAHDPYLTPGHAGSPSHYWSIPQDPLYFMHRRVPPTDPRISALRSAYRTAVAQVMRRVERLLTIINEIRGLENALVFVTSDHGQAFMEDGFLFHGFSVHDSVIRIPLLVHWPESLVVTPPSGCWMSIVDISPTIYDVVGLSNFAEETSGRSMLHSSPQDQREPVLAVTTGIHNRRVAKMVLSDSMYKRLDRVQVAGYYGEWKVTYDVCDRTTLTEHLYRDSPAKHAHVYEGDDAPAIVENLVRNVAQTVNPVAGEPERMSIADRLATWGY